MSKKYTLLSIIAELINEVGDLNNIQPYPYKLNLGIKNKVATFVANTPKGEAEVETIITLLSPEHKKYLNVPSMFDVNNPTIQLFNAGFTVEGEDAQFTKTDYALYIRIIKTVVEILKEVLIKHLNPIYNRPILMLASTTKDGMVGTEDTKLRYYRAVINNNLPPGYRVVEATFIGSKVLILQKIK